MDLRKRVLPVLITLLLVAVAPQLLQAQVTIPEGSEIDQAIFSVYVDWAKFQTVNLHRITADWGESSVTWNSFMGNFDMSVVGSFSTDTSGWHSVVVTPLVQAWVDGTDPNYGILMEQGLTPYTTYRSSENVTVPPRPKLEIWYTTPVGDSGYIVIQRPDVAQDGVADAYIWELNPTTNYNYDTLYTGNVRDFEKYSLVRFHFTVIPSSPGTGTPGYWKNHPEAWPVDVITIGGVPYTREEAISIMKMKKVKGDKTHDMFNQLVAAKLNVLIGNDPSCIADTISGADSWMATYGPVGSGVAAGGDESPWRVGEPLHSMLDQYNNGELCAPHRD